METLHIRSQISANSGSGDVSGAVFLVNILYNGNSDWGGVDVEI